MTFCRFSLPAFALLAVFPGTVFAQNADLIGAMRGISDQNMQYEEMLTNKTVGAVEDSTEEVKKTLILLESDRKTEDRTSAPLEALRLSGNALPQALSMTDQIAHDAMFNRQRELNRISMMDIYDLDGDGDKTEKADYLVDSSLFASVDIQSFDIFMRYFCDPKGRNGKLGEFSMPRSDVEYKGRKISYKLKCGSVEGGNIPTRQTYLSTDSDDSEEAQEVMLLSSRPGQLFFSPMTYPTAPLAGNSETTNTNKMAPLFYGAFAQSLQFMLGSAPGGAEGDNNIIGNRTALLDQQAKIARQMLASYPFAILFAERSGSMGPDAAQATAELLRTKLGTATEDKNILARIKNIQKRQTLSVAEYMDVVMYQLPTSPGYYTRINSELTPAQLRREAVWLSAMQTALNYQRNRWLEIQTALEAVK